LGATEESSVVTGVGIPPKVPRDFNYETPPTALGDVHNLSQCDREPIHVPGSIQPHGILLVADIGSLRILQVAGETDRIIGRRIDSIRGHTIAELLGSHAATLVASAQVTSEPVYLGSVAVAGAKLCLTAHDRDGVRILEIEPSSPLAQSMAEVLAQARNTAALFDRALDHTELLQSAAREARRLTGFDRVMIYKFLRDGCGSVVAEDRAEELRPFLNHRYPASDIPKQARELYLRNLIRVIPDVTYAPSPLIPQLNPATKAPLDMSECTLRSVSPIHVQYLKNMNVSASMSVSIVVDGTLWGLVAFHHMAPKLVPYELREICKHLGEILSQQIKAREDAEAHRQMLYLAAQREKLLGTLSKAGAIDVALLEHLSEVKRVIPADGAAVLFGDRAAATHRTPSQAQVRKLVGWLLDTAPSGVFETSSLVRQYAPAAGYAREASGLLATVVSPEEPLVLLWFRAEQLETINWAGNPHQPTEPGTAIGALNPRKSFEIWKETVHNQSEPWSTAEVDAARNLGRSIFELLQKQKLTELNARLYRSLSDKEALLLQKDLLMKEVNHRVQNGLQLVNAMLTLQAEEAGDEQVRAQFGFAIDRIMAIAMVHRRLWQTDHIRNVDFALYIQDLRDGLVETWGLEWADQVTVHGQSILISTDIAVVLALVIIELLTNAMKYAYGGRPGPIDVSIEQSLLGLHVAVKDQGVGMPAVHSKQGLGSRLTRGLVDELNGELKVDSSTQGTSVVISVPLAKASRSSRQ
jgi:chemotaxis family two-component system sensor kinase Cph1